MLSNESHQSNNEGGVWQSLSKEQQEEVLLAYEESENDADRFGPYGDSK